MCFEFELIRSLCFARTIILFQRTSPLKCYCDEKIVYSILILSKSIFEMRQNGISQKWVSQYLISFQRYWGFWNMQMRSVDVIYSQIKFIKWGISLKITDKKCWNFAHVWKWRKYTPLCTVCCCHGDSLVLDLFHL